MKRRLLLMVLFLVAMVSSMKVMAAEPYAVLKDGTLTFYYDNYKSSRASTGTVYNMQTSFNADTDIPWANVKENITKVVFQPSFSDWEPTDTRWWFAGLSNLTEVVGPQYLSTAEVTNMIRMFDGCKSLEYINLSNWNTSKVRQLSFMFKNCTKLKRLDLSKWNLSAGLDFQEMFNNCYNLTYLNVSTWNASHAKDTNGMFLGCANLKVLDLSSWDTGEVEDMVRMFSGCTKLEKIICGTGWSTKSVKNNKVANVFANCFNLVGEAGTVYDKNRTNAANAHIDGGPNNPGYLSSPKYVTIDSNIFPDNNFRSRLLDLEEDYYNKDKKFSILEIYDIIDLDFGDADISDLTGIDNFSELEYLNVSSNNLTSLDLSDNTELVNIDCSGNNLTSIILPYYNNLKSLSCEMNKIRGAMMDALIEQLPERSSDDKGKFYVYLNTEYSQTDGNELTPDQERAAREKGWWAYEYVWNGIKYVWNGSDGYVLLDEVNFPDPIFRNYLYENYYDQDFGPRLDIDDLESNIEEVSLVDTEEMSSMKGIEYFKELKEIAASGNRIKSLDASANKKLEVLDLSYNFRLESLIVANDGQIGIIDVGCNKLKGAAVDEFIASLPTRPASSPGTIWAANFVQDEEQNEFSKAQVAAANAKNWKVKANTSKGWQDYQGGSVGITTVIDNAQAAATKDSPYYNLQGQRVKSTKKGIYIHNGRKTILK